MSALGGMVLAGTAMAVVGAGTPAEMAQVRPASSRPCVGYCKYPTNAAAVFRWGKPAWDQEFEVGSLGNNWKSNHPGLIYQVNGMLTLDASKGPANVTAYPSDQAARVGRWEARVRAREPQKGTGAHYRYTWELVPASGDDSCGANRIVLGTYSPGDTRVRGSVNTLPDHRFTYARKRDLRSLAWHTYAVEITKRHISWFVDTKVIRTERRRAALSGIRYRPQFVMQSVPGATMRPSFMQMDWVRYYTLKRPNAHSIDAPQMHLTTVTPRC
ncbi:MAG TPA: glycoside hydrolase family 16 protein [Nocardioides sp.]|uniref:glycoside hydrolase family 16 protein n=1 Tax=Nocardioides sp. TaxID=35761 RepID=UPI002F4294E0